MTIWRFLIQGGDDEIGRAEVAADTRMDALRQVAALTWVDDVTVLVTGEIAYPEDREPDTVWFGDEIAYVLEDGQ